LEINKAFGQLLKSIREQEHISQEKLAELCGLDRTFISLLERGLRQPSLTTLFRLSRALEITPHEFVRKLEDMHPETDSDGDSI
jgi:transcriptional regulator with XRE-family HTH domain